MISMEMIEGKKPKLEGPDRKRIHLSDIIGNFGYFQFYVTLFSALREAIVAFDVVVMPSLLSKKLTPECCNLLSIYNQFKSNETTTSMTSNETNYSHCLSISNADSLMKELNLQCDPRADWYIALIETSYLVGFIPGNLTLGYCSDRFGRTKTYLVSHAVALIGGVASILVRNYWLFVFSRFLTATGSCGFNIIYTISLELVGIKFRAMNTLVNHFGWGLGVVLIPIVDRLSSSNHNYILAFCPLISALMLVWALFLLPESPLWLMSNAKYSKGKEVLQQILKLNKNHADLDENIDQFEKQMKEDKLKQEESLSQLRRDDNDLGGSNPSIYNSQQKHRILFSNPSFRCDTIILAYTGFVAALFYYILAMNFSYVQNLSPEANFISTGVGEWIGVLICIGLLKCSTRRFCFSISFLFLMSSFVFQSYLDHIAREETLLVTMTNATGSIFTCALIFLIVMVSMEVLPTNLRNTGSSIIDTTTHCGSAMAPLFIQLSRIIGNDKTDLFYACLSLIGVVAIQFLTKTDHIELSDV